MDEYRVTVWVGQSEQRFLVVASLDAQTVLSVTSGVVYPEQRVLHLVTTESCSAVKGLGRAVLVHSLRYLSGYLGHPLIYLYSRPRPFFYLPREEAAIHPTWLCSYWTGVLSAIGYQPAVIGHQAVATGEFSSVLARHPEIAACWGLFEDDPVTRVLEHSPGLSIDQVFAILGNSKDFAKGNLVLARYAAERAGSWQRENTAPNSGFRAAAIPLETIQQVLVSGSVAGLAKYPSACLKVPSSELAKQETVKVFRMKRNK